MNIYLFGINIENISPQWEALQKDDFVNKRDSIYTYQKPQLPITITYTEMSNKLHCHCRDVSTTEKALRGNASTRRDTAEAGKEWREGAISWDRVRHRAGYLQ